MSAQPMWVEGMHRGSKVGPTWFEISHSPGNSNRHIAGLIDLSTRWVDCVSQQHLTVVVHRLNEDLLLADSQVIEAVLSLAVPVLAPHVGPGGGNSLRSKLMFGNTHLCSWFAIPCNSCFSVGWMDNPKKSTNLAVCGNPIHPAFKSRVPQKSSDLSLMFLLNSMLVVIFRHIQIHCSWG